MDRPPDIERPLVPTRRADRPDRATRPPADAEVTLAVHAYADGRQIVVRRATAGGATVHIDAVVR